MIPNNSPTIIYALRYNWISCEENLVNLKISECSYAIPVAAFDVSSDVGLKPNFV